MNEKEENIDNEQNKDEGIIAESDLLDVYEFQYNDLFPKILKIKEQKFLSLLEEQVLLHLRVINKLSDLSLMSYFQDFITERYKADKKKVQSDIEKVKKLPENEIKYLNYSNCYIHCHHNLDALHKCLNKLIYFGGFVYCLKCNKIYNENQIKLYCNKCDEIYYSNVRKEADKNRDNYFPVCYANNHCPSEEDEEELMRCLECGEVLYCDLSKIKEENNKYDNKSEFIKEITCIKCKFDYNLREINFFCSECEGEFKSDAQLYNEFPFYKKRILFIVHSLKKNKLALPDNYKEKKCKCDINIIKNFYHETDKGILLEGYKDIKNKIICEHCLKFFDDNKFEWKCPSCGVKFKCVKSNKNIDDNKSELKNDDKNGINKDDKNEIKNDNINEINIKQNEIKYDNLNIIKNEENKNEIKEDNEDNKNIIKNYINEIKNEQNNNINNNNKEENQYNEPIYNPLDNNKLDNIGKLSEEKINKEIEIKDNNDNQNKNYIYNNHNILFVNNNENRQNYKEIIEIKEKKKEEREKYENIASKVIIQKRSNNNINNNDILRKNNMDIHKDYSNIIDKIRNEVNNIRVKYQLGNLNVSDKNLIYNRKSALIQKSNDEVNKNRNIGEFDNIKKYFENFNIELKKELENKKIKKELKKEERDRDFISNKNLRIINLDSSNNKRENKSNMHIINMNNIYNISNKAVNDIKNKNIICTDSKYNYIEKYKKKENVSPVNISQIKKRDLSFDRILRNIDLSQDKYKRKNIDKDNKINNDYKDNNINNHNYHYVNIQNKNNINIINNIKSEPQEKIINKRNNINNINININKYNSNKKEEDKFKYEIKYKPENIVKNIIRKDIDIKNPSFNNNNLFNLNSNNYKNIRILGQGSYGKIYLVEDIKTKERFAMKKLILDDKLDLSDNQDEYSMIKNINTSHPEIKIIHVYGTETKTFDDYNFVFYVLMELANCDWEKELLNRSRHKAYYTEEELFNILEDLVDTFEFLQKSGICHRDIKPQNILCFGKEGYKISDFGEAKYRKKWRMKQSAIDYTSTQTVRGTELYMSPVLYTALKTSPNSGVSHNAFKSDVFSLGMCFLFASCLDYTCLYDIRKCNNMENIYDIILQCSNGKYSDKFTDIMLTMLDINEKDRPDFIELKSIMINLN